MVVEKLLIKVFIRIYQMWWWIGALLGDRSGTGRIPDDLIQEIARCLLPDIVAYCESEEGKQEFAKWQEKRDQENLRKSRTFATEHP